MAAVHSLTREDLRAVATQMQRGGDTTAGPLEATPLTGGRSNLTYRLDDGTSSWVLRTPPRHGRTPSAHDVAREFTVTRALVPTAVPVPYPVVLCQDEAVIGVPFVVTRFVPGASVQTRAELDAFDDPAVSAIVASLIESLVALHTVDYERVGLQGFGRAGGFAQRQIRRWTAQWTLVGSAESSPAAHELADRLAAIEFVQDCTGVVHGDYRIDNTLIGLGNNMTDMSITAIVDWELSTIGDPTADVAMMCVYRHPALDLILGSPSAWTSPRLPATETLAQCYEQVSGKPLRQWNAHMALGYFKLAVIAAGIDHRYRAGAAPRDGFENAAAAVPELLEAGLERVNVISR